MTNDKSKFDNYISNQNSHQLLSHDRLRRKKSFLKSAKDVHIVIIALCCLLLIPSTILLIGSIVVYTMMFEFIVYLILFLALIAIALYQLLMIKKIDLELEYIDEILL